MEKGNLSQESKDLLLKDLCARLPYGVKVKTNDDDEYYTLLAIHPNKDIAVIGIQFDNVFATSKIKIENIKPYLRKMSNMTEEELHEVQEILGKGVEINKDFISIVDSSINSFTYLELKAVFDWFNKKMFDYNGLIPKGLALVAQKGMYN